MKKPNEQINFLNFVEEKGMKAVVADYMHVSYAQFSKMIHDLRLGKHPTARTKLLVAKALSPLVGRELTMFDIDWDIS